MPSVMIGIPQGDLAKTELGSNSEPDRLPPEIPEHTLVRLIGRGSYGEVWLAQNLFETYRAIKVIHRDSFRDNRPYAREFEGIRKFEPISRSHESQVEILQVGKNDEKGYFYYVMELADDASKVTGSRDGPKDPLAKGSPSTNSRRRIQCSVAPSEAESYVPHTLQEEFRRQGRIPVNECLEISLSLATALEVLHENGLVHRDVKPSNVVYVNGVPKLADIGMVARLDETQSFVGTEGFLAPEGPGTSRADLYSLGKLLFEASTGQDCREFPDLPADLRDLSDREELIELNEIILKACSQDPKSRYRSAGEMRKDLEILAKGESLRREIKSRRNRRNSVAVCIAIFGIVMGSTVWNLIWKNSGSEVLSSQSKNPVANGNTISNGNASPDGQHGLRVVRRIELPGVWQWARARVAQWQGASEPILFVPQGEKIWMLSKEGKVFHEWTTSSRRTAGLGINMIERSGNGTGENVILSWKTGGKLCLSVVNQNMYEIKRFTTEGNVKDGEFGEVGLSIIEAEKIFNSKQGNRKLLIASVGTGADLKPRGIYCFNYEDEKLIWNYPTAPYITEVETADLNGDKDLEIIVGSHAVENGNTRPDGTSDRFSYVYALDSSGALIWRREIADTYTLTHPIAIDADDGGKDDVLVWVECNHEAREVMKKPEIGFVVRFDAQGEEVARYDAEARLTSCRIADLDGNGPRTVLVTDRQGFLHVLDANLELQQKTRLVTNRFEMVDLRIQGIEDLDQDTSPEIILSSSQIQYVAGLNLGNPEDPPNVRHYHDNSVILLNSRLMQIASYTVAEKWPDVTKFRVEVADFTGDGRLDILSLADQALVLELK